MCTLSRQPELCVTPLLLHTLFRPTESPASLTPVLCVFFLFLQKEWYLGHANLGSNMSLLLTTRRILLVKVSLDPDKPYLVCVCVCG